MNALDDTRINDAGHAAKLAMLDALGVADAATKAQAGEVLAASAGLVLSIIREMGLSVAVFSVLLATLDATNPDTPARRQ
jgi:hypothetical protein